MWKFGTLTVSPFDWLEASYFYYRPTDLIWEGNNKSGDYLDKGFNVKFILRSNNRNIPSLAVGLDDFAGTGLFTREYLVTSHVLKDIKFHYGIGWGKFAGENDFKNPLYKISERLTYRPANNANNGYGGTPSYDQWFRGNASYFGGFEYTIPNSKDIKIKIEYDPFNYFDFSANQRSDASEILRKKENNLNFGLSVPISKFFTLEASYIKGNTFNISFSAAITFNEKLRKKPKFNPSIKKETNIKNKQSFYEDLLVNLNNNNLFLQTASVEDKKLNIAISTSQHRNALRSSSYAAYISNEVSKLNNIDLSVINVSHINAGMELNKIQYVASHLDNKNKTPIEVKKLYTEFDSTDSQKYLENEFRPNINFPVMFSSLSPALISHIGNPEKFYFGGVALQHVSEIQLKRNLLISTQLNYSLYNNVQDTISGPGSEIQHVRTDLVQYLKEDDFYITRLQMDYIWSPFKSTFIKLSGGIFENMYGGFGAEILYKPFDSNLNIGAELFYVKQRTFKQLFDFLDYSTTTGHLNFGYILPLGIEANLSFGRYLAKDDGYTFDISRRTKSGFRAGIYFTRTDIPKELFGEGSFDKGFYFQIPMDLLNKDYVGNYSTFKVSPLTRDGGAKLIYDKSLRGLINNSTIRELNSQWNGFLN